MLDIRINDNVMLDGYWYSITNVYKKIVHLLRVRKDWEQGQPAIYRHKNRSELESDIINNKIIIHRYQQLVPLWMLMITRGQMLYVIEDRRCKQPRIDGVITQAGIQRVSILWKTATPYTERMSRQRLEFYIKQGVIALT